MRVILVALLALFVTGLWSEAANACPPGYEPCGRGVCCPR